MTLPNVDAADRRIWVRGLKRHAMYTILNFLHDGFILHIICSFNLIFD